MGEGLGERARIRALARVRVRVRVRGRGRGKVGVRVRVRGRPRVASTCLRKASRSPSVIVSALAMTGTRLTCGSRRRINSMSCPLSLCAVMKYRHTCTRPG